MSAMFARFAVMVLLAVPAAVVAQRDIPAEYDVSQSVTVTGFVSKLDWGG